MFTSLRSKRVVSIWRFLQSDPLLWPYSYPWRLWKLWGWMDLSSVSEPWLGLQLPRRDSLYGIWWWWCRIYYKCVLFVACTFCLIRLMWCNLGKSVWSRTCDIFSFLFWLKCSFGSCCKPHLILISGSKVMNNWRIHKTIKTKINFVLFLSMSHNQCFWFSTDSARSNTYGQFILFVTS